MPDNRVYVPFRHRSSERVRQLLVEIVLSILNFLATHPKERLPGDNPDWIGASRYEIRTNMPGTQHDTIIGDGLERLLRLGLIAEKTTTGAAKYYRITEEGRDWYNKKGNSFLDFARDVRTGRFAE